MRKQFIDNDLDRKRAIGNVTMAIQVINKSANNLIREISPYLDDLFIDSSKLNESDADLIVRMLEELHDFSRALYLASQKFGNNINRCVDRYGRDYAIRSRTKSGAELMRKNLYSKAASKMRSNKIKSDMIRTIQNNSSNVFKAKYGFKLFGDNSDPAKKELQKQLKEITDDYSKFLDFIRDINNNIDKKHKDITNKIGRLDQGLYRGVNEIISKNDELSQGIDDSIKELIGKVSEVWVFVQEQLSGLDISK